MKNTHTLFLSIIALMFSAVTTAQEKKQLNDQQKTALVEQLKTDREKLALTEEQKGPFAEITKKYAEKMKEVNANTELSKLEKLKELKKLRMAKDEEIKVILTEDQFKIYEQIREDRKEKLRERRK
ncbi:MAG: hypothetical protein CFE23_05705 [Flavobacterium sp. BFFFF1]|uniref:hypothetical protein n=1 Tax=Flavobacterium sp. BFFFF1 TaxID=2015557 RepID=UPI000BDB9B6B|nr:hypothetical protein [Flavobacterium sp. BFFFF1]OYU81258.1 MAG: hypothetical protein CFE23_05705 [Flavobacterium sp. BFFFF1]